MKLRSFASAPARTLVVVAAALVLTAGALAIGQQSTARQGPSGKPVPSGPQILVGPNVRASANTTTGGRNECWLVAGPKSPRFLIGVAQATPGDNLSGGPRRCSTMISRNGGQTWREIPLPKQADGAFDPMVTAAADGRVYLMHAMIGGAAGAMLGMTESGQQRQGTIQIWSTTDEGRTWKGPSEIACPLQPDHPRMVVDTSDGPHRGRLYVAWNEVSDTFLKKKYHIFLHYSDDGGETFSDAILLGTDEGGKLVTTEPVVLSDGTLLVTYYQYYWPLSDSRNDAQPFYIIRSADGAMTFGKPEKVATVGSSAWRHLRQNFRSAFTLPIVVSDTSASSPHRDRIYMVWDDVTGGQSTIWFLASADKGKTWSKPLRLNDNSPAPAGGPPDFRMTPVVSVNRAGVVGVAWYDRRDDPTRRCWKQYFTASLDGGASFLSNVAVSSAPSCPGQEANPTLYVWNTSPDVDDTLPTEEELVKLQAAQRRQLEEEVGIAKAWREANRDVKGAKLRVAFDQGRSVWPGHYTGLAADSDGVFHAFWADRRNKLQQIFTASIEIVATVEGAPPTEETSVTDQVRLIAGPGKWDEAKSTSTFELQVRNVSDRPIYGPIKVRVTRLAPESPATVRGPKGAKPVASATLPVVIVGADAGGSGIGAVWDFSKLLGSRGRLDPMMISEAKTITIRTQAETGLDGQVEFEVLGRVVRK